jgi:hypothetical protein
MPEHYAEHKSASTQLNWVFNYQAHEILCLINNNRIISIEGGFFWDTLSVNKKKYPV